MLCYGNWPNIGCIHPSSKLLGLGCWGYGAWFESLGFGRVVGLSFEVQGSGFRVQGLGYRVVGYTD